MRFLTLVLSLISFNCISQFQDLVIVKLDNGSIPGDTYQFYAQLQNEGDHIHIVFGDEYNTLSIETTEPFYQNELGGALSTNINPKIVSLDKTVQYDSYFTIGLQNAKDNTLANFNLDLTDFEEKGDGLVTSNGAWYVTPDQPQAYCRDGNQFIMIMQLTTEGKISGNLNMQGKDNNGETWREVDYKFSTDNAISKKDFSKKQKSLIKAFKKDQKKKKKKEGNLDSNNTGTEMKEEE